MRVYKHKKYTYVTIAEIPYSEIEEIKTAVCKEPRERIDTWYKRQKNKPSVVVNGGLFDMSSGMPCGVLVADGKFHSMQFQYQDGIGTPQNNKKNLIADMCSNRKWDSFINGYPVLIKNNVATTIAYGKELNYATRRTVMGYNEDNVFFVCVDKPGMKFNKLQEICLELGMKYAINLDGGGSTRMLVNGVRKTKTATNRAVDNLIAVYTKINSHPVDYYVRTKVASLNIRSGPGASSYALNGKISKNTECHIVAEAAGESGSAPLWGQLDDGRGWIAITSSYVNKADKSTAEFTPYDVKINATVLRVRSGPSTKYKQVGSKRRDNIVTILDENNGWGRIGANMWISLDYTIKV